MLKSDRPRIEVYDITKSFGSSQVLSAVSLIIQPGEIHGLVGENGSGKSTLVKILTGYHGCDKGASISLDGNALSVPLRWEEAHKAGISVVHQDLGLIDDLTVSENIGVGGYPVRGPFHTIDWKLQEEVAVAALERLSSSIAPRTLVGSLSAAQRAEVAVARALRDHKLGSGLIILDESTRSLTRDEMVRFYGMLHEVVNQGTSVLLVSHNLEEVLAQTDRVTVLRDGVVVGSGLLTSELSERELMQRMLGKEVSNLAVRTVQNGYVPAVAITGLTGDGMEDLDFSIGKGEVVGITGLSGSGFEHIPYLLSGARPVAGGTVRIADETICLSKASVHRCIRAGIALVPERREQDGLAFELSMSENITLPTLRSRGKSWFVSRRWQDEESQRMSHDLGIRPSDPSLLVKQFSGGNQQKVLLAKWLSAGPRLLVLHEPTQAVDVGAKRDILGQIHQVAKSGISVLVVSIDVSDLAAVCNRVLVFSSSRKLVEISSLDVDEIMDMVYSRSGAA